MRTVPAAITAAREAASSRLCKVWEITRLDEEVLRFTEHDRDIVYDGDTYYATASFDASAIRATADMAVGDIDVQGAFDTEYITAEDLLAGRYNGASFWVGELLWDDPDEGVDILRFGWLGRVKEIGGKFVAELLGPAARLQQTIGEIYSPTCRAEVGDSRCGVTLTEYDGAVASVVSRRQFTQEYLSDEYGTLFVYGKITWTTGNNAGLSMDIAEHDDATIGLFLPMPFDIEAGDEFTMTGGCDKSLAMCRDRWANVLNFRGEPHAPVSDDLIRGPGADVSRGSGGSAGDVSPDPAPDEPEVPTISGSPIIED